MENIDQIAKYCDSGKYYPVSSLWGIKSFVDLEGGRKLIVGGDDSLDIYPLDEECKIIEKKNIVSWTGFYNYFEHYRFENRDFIIFEHATGKLYSVDLSDLSFTFISECSGSYSGAIVFQLLDDGICAYRSNDNNSIDFIRLDEHIKKCERKTSPSILPTSLPTEHDKSTVISSVRYKGIIRLSAMHYYSKTKSLFGCGGNVQCKLIVIDVSKGFENLSIKQITECKCDYVTTLNTMNYNNQNYLIVGGHKIQEIYEIISSDTLKLVSSILLSSGVDLAVGIISFSKYSIIFTEQDLYVFDVEKLITKDNNKEEEEESELYELHFDFKESVKQPVYHVCWVEEPLLTCGEKKRYFYTGGQKGNLDRWKSFGERIKRKDTDEEERRNYILDVFEENFSFCNLYVSDLTLKIPIWFLWKS